MSRLSRGTAGAIALVLLTGPALLVAGPATAATNLPYSDPKAKGYIAFCDSQGQSVSGGNIKDLPFVATAISSEPAPAGYAVKNGKATLYAYQPRQGVDPGEWSSQPLSGSSIYSNAKHPMASVTTADKPLEQILQAYPARWDGLLQLRMFYSAPNMQPYTIQYPATSIRVTGDTWRIVDGGTVPCNVGKAVSIETILLPPSSFPAPSKVAATASTPTGSTPSADTTGSTVLAGDDGGQPTPASGDSNGALIGLLAVAGVGVLAGLVSWIRQRSVRTP